MIVSVWEILPASGYQAHPNNLHLWVPNPLGSELLIDLFAILLSMSLLSGLYHELRSIHLAAMALQFWVRDVLLLVAAAPPFASDVHFRVLNLTGGSRTTSPEPWLSCLAVSGACTPRPDLHPWHTAPEARHPRMALSIRAIVSRVRLALSHRTGAPVKLLILLRCNKLASSLRPFRMLRLA